MSENPNKLNRFWQELKRRKTGKVIIAYAATAFIILQLVDILAPAWLLPEWTARLVSLILLIGFPVAVIFSWIFDITPEGIKKTAALKKSVKKVYEKKPFWRIFTASNIITVTLIVVVGILAYPKIFKQDTLEKLRSSDERISVAVMPFKNMTNDSTLDYLQVGIQFSLITALSIYPEEIKVSQPESINRFIQDKGTAYNASITPSFASSLAKKLEANTFIYGSISREESIIRLTAQLINSETKEVYKSFNVENAAGKVLSAIDSLSDKVSDFLILSKLNKGLPPSAQIIVTTTSPEAYRYFIMGLNGFYSLDFASSTQNLLKAVDVDSNFTAAILYLSGAYLSQDLLDQAKKWCFRAYERRDFMTPHLKAYTNFLYARCFETPYQEIKYMKELLMIDNQAPLAHYEIGNGYWDLNLYEQAIPEYEKTLKIYEKWGHKPLWVYYYVNLGRAYHNTGQYKKERELYRKAEQDFPDYALIISRQTILSLTEKDTIAANQLIDKYKLILRGNSISEADINTGLAEIYSEANILKTAEKYFRKALLSEPENSLKINDLALFLIDKDQNLNEGMELINKAIELSPGNYNYLHTKGWALYKQGKYKEALNLLEKSWERKTKIDNGMYAHLEAAKKAVAGMKGD